MSKTAARFTLADIARATRAAKEQGAQAVEILRDGTIRVVLKNEREKGEEPEPPKYPDVDL